MELIDKAHIIAEFYAEYEDVYSDTILTYFLENNLGVFYSFGLDYGHIESLTVAGETEILTAWDNLISTLDIENRDYDSLYDLATTAGIATDNVLSSSEE